MSLLMAVTASALSLTAFATASPEIYFCDESGKAVAEFAANEGEYVNFGVGIKNNTGLSSLTIKIKFDKTVLSLDNKAADSFTDKGLFSGRDGYTFLPSVNWLNASGNSGNGLLGVYKLKAVAGGECAPQLVVTEALDTGSGEVAIATATCTFTCTAEQEEEIDEGEIVIIPPNKKFYVGQTVTKSDLIVKKTYKNGDETVISSSEYELANATLSLEGENTVMVIYSGVEYQIIIEASTEEEEEIDEGEIVIIPPNKKFYVGQTVTKSDLIVKKTYKNGDETVISAADYELKNAALTAVGENKVTVVYDGESYTTQIEASEDTISKIEILTMPSKTEYYVGESFSVEGMTLKATYLSSKTSVIESGNKSIYVKTPDLTSAGSKTVVITFGGKSTSFSVTVKEKEDPLKNTVLYVPSAVTVDYRTKVTFVAKAKSLPKGYYLVVSYGSKQAIVEGKGENEETAVTVNYGEMKENTEFSVKIVDSDSNLAKTSSGSTFEGSTKVSVNRGFFKRIIAFFKNLFGKLPTQIVEKK